MTWPPPAPGPDDEYPRNPTVGWLRETLWRRFGVSATAVDRGDDRKWLVKEMTARGYAFGNDNDNTKDTVTR